MTTRQRPLSACLRLVLLTVLTALAALFLPGLHASASGLPAAETRVGAIHPTVTTAVEVAEHIASGQRRSRAPSQLRLVVGHCVAAEDGTALSGRTVLGESWDDAIRAARGAKGEAGFFDVIGHGTPNSVFDAAGNALSPADLAGIIRGTPSWGEQSVRLLACSTGCPTGSFAQSLANELGVVVKAPTTDFLVNSRGGIVVDPGGAWRMFSPG